MNRYSYVESERFYRSLYFGENRRNWIKQQAVKGQKKGHKRKKK